LKLKDIYNGLIEESKILFNEISEKQPCDCCKYFDFSFTQAGAYYTGLVHPIYSILEKNKREQLKYINPKQYIYAIARGFGGLSYADVVDSGAVSKDNVKKYANDMRNGDKFPIGWYDISTGGQEGRHRALAAMELGCTEIPVVVRDNVGYYGKLEFAKKHKDLSRDELNQTFISMGYDGITDLDWNTLRRFISYNL
jgi:hypothetical protein